MRACPSDQNLLGRIAPKDVVKNIDRSGVPGSGLHQRTWLKTT